MKGPCPRRGPFLLKIARRYQIAIQTSPGLTDLMSMQTAIMPQPAPPVDLRVSSRSTLGYIAHEYNMDEIATRLRRHGYRGAITGPAGCGKTIMLQALGDELMEHGLSPLPLTIDPQRNKALPTDWRRTIRNARPTDALLLDGYDLLPRWARLWVLLASRRAGAVVVTANKDVHYKSLAKPRSTAHLLELLIARMLPASNLDLDCNAIFQECQGNLNVAMDLVNQRIQG